jgi:lysophospholipid acyltransferase (LPLAT)-like uncharacterized protein
MKKKLILFALRLFLWRVIFWWCRTVKITRIDHEQFDAMRSMGKNFVVVFWHGSMLIGWFLHRPEKVNNISALVSQSNDGEYLSSVLERWGYKLIRGSSHIGGKEAMQLMTDSIEQGQSLALTPDGPRGPRHEMKMGAIRAAQKTSVPLFLAGIAVEKKRNLKSWDVFEIPIPFSTAAVAYSEAIMVPKELDGEPLDLFKMKMQTRLDELTMKAEQRLYQKVHG